MHHGIVLDKRTALIIKRLDKYRENGTVTDSGGIQEAPTSGTAVSQHMRKLSTPNLAQTSDRYSVGDPSSEGAANTNNSKTRAKRLKIRCTIAKIRHRTAVRKKVYASQNTTRTEYATECEAETTSVEN
eukprot:9903414-Karenia_brevis.AAC.1